MNEWIKISHHYLKDEWGIRILWMIAIIILRMESVLFVVEHLNWKAMIWEKKSKKRTSRALLLYSGLERYRHEEYATAWSGMSAYGGASFADPYGSGKYKWWLWNSWMHQDSGWICHCCHHVCYFIVLCSPFLFYFYRALPLVFPRPFNWFFVLFILLYVSLLIITIHFRSLHIP